MLPGTTWITDGPERKTDEIGDAAEWAERVLRFRLDSTQARTLRSGSRRVILNCTRQWGKSTVIAAKAVHQALTQPGSLTLVASGCQPRRSREPMREWRRYVGTNAA